MEIFENACFSFACERTKRDIYEYDDVIHHIVRELRMLRKECYHISIVLALPRFLFRAKTILIRYVWTRIFLKTAKQIAIYKNIRILVDGVTDWHIKQSYTALKQYYRMAMLSGFYSDAI